MPSVQELSWTRIPELQEKVIEPIYTNFPKLDEIRDFAKEQEILLQRKVDNAHLFAKGGIFGENKLLSLCLL